MAASSPWRWPSRCVSTTSLYCLSMNFQVSCRKQRRFIRCSAGFDSSSCPCGSSVPTFSNGLQKKLKKGIVGGITTDKGDLENDKAVSSSGSRGGDFINRSRFKPSSRKLGFGRRLFFASRKVRSIVLLNVIAFIYASDIPVMKEAEAIVDPEVFTVIRFALAAIPFIPFIYKARDDFDTRNAGVELGFWVSLGYILQAIGLLTSGAGRASFISAFTVIVVPLIDGMLGSVVPARTWFGALMSIIGIAMLESNGSPPCVGDLLNFLSAVAFGIHMLRTEHISRSTKKENFLPLLGYEVCAVTLLATIWYIINGFFGGAIRYLNPSSWTFETISSWISLFPWLPALYTGILSTGLCLWVEMTAMRHVSAKETAIIYGLEPLWGAGFAWVLLGERWGVGGWIGAALVLGGSVTVQMMGTSESCRKVNSQRDESRSFSTSLIVIKTVKDSTKLKK